MGKGKEVLPVNISDQRRSVYARTNFSLPSEFQIHGALSIQQSILISDQNRTKRNSIL